MMQNEGISINQDKTAVAGNMMNVPAVTERYEDKNFVDTTKAVWNYSILYDNDVETFQNGTHYSLYNKFGSKRLTVLDRDGYYFCVWAPNATQVSVIGNFNNWD